MQPNYKIKSGQKKLKKTGQKKSEGEALGFSDLKKFRSQNYFSKNYLGSSANLMVCAKSAKCILVILSELEAAAALTVPLRATN